MMISGGDFDDAIDVIDVWLYVDNPAKEPENGVLRIYKKPSFPTNTTGVKKIAPSTISAQSAHTHSHRPTPLIGPQTTPRSPIQIPLHAF